MVSVWQDALQCEPQLRNRKRLQQHMDVSKAPSALSLVPVTNAKGTISIACDLRHSRSRVNVIDSRYGDSSLPRSLRFRVRKSAMRTLVLALAILAFTGLPAAAQQQIGTTRSVRPAAQGSVAG